MTTEDRRRFPLWVPIAAAAAGALVAFAAATVLDFDRDESVTVTPGSQPAAVPASTQGQPAAEQSTSADPAATSGAPVSAPQILTPASELPATSSGTQPPTGSASDTTISREQAGAIAAAHVDGVVDSIHTEDDYGAAWDVDVYAPDGEYTIYVSAAGQIVRVMGPYIWD